MPQRKRGARFHGVPSHVLKHHTTAPAAVATGSASSRKMKTAVVTECPLSTDRHAEGYRLVGMEVLGDFLRDLVRVRYYRKTWGHRQRC